MTSLHRVTNQPGPTSSQLPEMAFMHKTHVLYFAYCYVPTAAVFIIYCFVRYVRAIIRSLLGRWKDTVEVASRSVDICLGTRLHARAHLFMATKPPPD